MLILPTMLHSLCLFTRPDKLQEDREQRGHIQLYSPQWTKKRPQESTNFMPSSSTGSFLPACVQQGLLSLLVSNRVFFPCWSATGSSFPAGAQQGLLSLLASNKVVFPSWCKVSLTNFPWQPNKLATPHKTHKLGRQSSNDHNCQIWLYHFTCFGENAI